MDYTKQNFENGQVLTAEQLNHMEEGIRRLSEELSGLFVSNSGDTLNWNGSTTGLVLAEVNSYDTPYKYYKVSAVVPTATDLENGFTLRFVRNGVMQDLDTTVSTMTKGLVSIKSEDVPYAFFVPESFLTYGMFAESGVYFRSDGSDYVTSITINGYTGFFHADGKRIDPQYIPELRQLSEDKVNKPSVAGTAGQFLTSDGNGGTAWVSLPMYNGEVEDV